MNVLLECGSVRYLKVAEDVAVAAVAAAATIISIGIIVISAGGFVEEASSLFDGADGIGDGCAFVPLLPISVFSTGLSHAGSKQFRLSPFLATSEEDCCCPENESAGGSLWLQLPSNRA